MKNNLILRLVDSSSKECEVTGRMMGGNDVYEIPVTKLKLGFVDWPQNGRPDHSINILAIGENSVKLSVRSVSGSWNEYTLQLGEKASSSYCFGEWSYGYTVTLVEVDENKKKGFIQRKGNSQRRR